MLTWLEQLVAPLNTVVFVMGNDHVSWAEILGFVTGVACVWLTVKADPEFPSRHCELRLLSPPIRHGTSLGRFKPPDPLHRARLCRVVAVAARRTSANPPRRGTEPAVGVCWRSLFPCLRHVGSDSCPGAARDVAPFWDALTTCLSLVAQGLLNWKKLETWYFWIAADTIYVPLYVVKRLDLTAIVYVLFLTMCFLGLREWRRVERDQYDLAERAVPVQAGTA